MTIDFDSIRKWRGFTLLRFVLVLVVSAVSGWAQANTAEQPAKAQNLARSWEMPNFFEQNQGQAPKDVLYQARTRDYLVYVKPGAFVIVPNAQGAEPLTFRFVATTGGRAPRGEQPLQAKVNYFIGSDPQTWRRNIATFQSLKQSDLYPGIDLIYRFTDQGKLEYDLVVAPGVDARQIRMEVAGGSQLSLSSSGSLIMQSNHGPVEQLPPLVYQTINGEKQVVQARYQLLSNNQLGMQIDKFDTHHALVVDPVLTYSSYIGGSDRDSARGVVWNEGDRSIYITGGTSTQTVILTDDSYTVTNSGFLSSAMEATAHQPKSAVETNGCVLNYDPSRGNGKQQNYSAYDAFVAKIDLDSGALLFATYYGGCANEQSRDIALDKNGDGSVYIVGTTLSRDLAAHGKLTPTVPGGDRYEVDAFVAKFDANGQLVYGRYIGGEAADYGRAIAVDIEGYAYIVGNTSSAHIEVNTKQFTCFGRVVPVAEGTSCYMGQTDAFFARIGTDGTTADYGTYIGGYGTDWAADIALSNAIGNDVKIYIAGTTAATTADPASPGYKHDFPFNTSVRPYKYYVPGNCGDSGVEFVNDKHPCRDAFVVVLDQIGRNLKYATMVGGAGDEVATGLAVDPSENIYLTGYSTSTGVIAPEGDPGNIIDPNDINGNQDKEKFIRFPLYNPVNDVQGYELNYSLFGGTEPKAFLTKFDAISAYKDIQFSTFIGGSGIDKATGVVVSTVPISITTPNGNVDTKINTIYLAGQTLSQDFSPLNQTFKSVADGEDIFLVKMTQLEYKYPETVFSTLFGAEGLDSANGMVQVTEGGVSKGVILVGKTSSTLFPTTSSAFSPSFAGGPDDGFITYIEDQSLATNLILKSAGYILPTKVGDTAEFAFEVSNGGEQVAEQVRISVYLPPSVNLTLKPSGCVLENKQILFCDLNDLYPQGAGVSSNSINLAFVPRVGGELRVRAAVQSNRVDDDLDDNIVTIPMTVEEQKLGATYLNTLFVIVLFMVLFGLRSAYSSRRN